MTGKLGWITKKPVGLFYGSKDYHSATYSKMSVSWKIKYCDVYLFSYLFISIVFMI